MAKAAAKCLTPMRANIVWAAILGDEDQRLHRSLPFRRVMFGFRKSADRFTGLFFSLIYCGSARRQRWRHRGSMHRTFSVKDIAPLPDQPPA
jgi:hypothetical protein